MYIHRVAGGYGIGGIGQGGYGIPIVSLQPITEFYFGEYHNLINTRPPTLTPQQISFSWDDYPMGDSYNSDDYATVIGEPLANSRAEISAQLFIIRNIYTGGNFTATWYRDRDKAVLFTFSFTIPDPTTQGYQYWSWYAIYSWIGKFPTGISEPGHYFTTIITDWGNYIHDYDVIAPTCITPVIVLNISV